MFVIELTYTATLDRIDACMKEHVAFLDRHYAAGTFVMSGRQIPRTGGIILAIAESREAIEQLIQQDPFCARGLAQPRIVEFRASQRADDMDARVAADTARLGGTRRSARKR